MQLAVAVDRVSAVVAAAPVRVMLVFMTVSLAYLAMDPWHNWGGDYAYYLGVARNIFFDRPLETANVGVVAPTGFSWFLSKVAPLVDWQFLALKRFNLIWVVIYCALVLWLSKHIPGPLGRLAFVGLATLNAGIWYYSNQILTELIFLAILTGAFLLVLRAEAGNLTTVWRSCAGLFALALLACTLRQAALLMLLVPPFLYLDGSARTASLKRGLIFSGLLAGCAATAMIVYHAPWFHAAAHSHLAASDTGLGSKILFMLSKYDIELAALAAGLLGDVRSIGWGAFVSGLVIIAVAARLAARRLSVAVLLGAVILPLVYVPWTPPDGRYWFPMLGIISFLAVEGALILAGFAGLQRYPVLGRPFVAGLLVLLSWHHITATNRIFLFDRDKGVFEENAGEMFHWIHYNTEWGKRVCFYKPRILGFHANWNNVCLIDQASSPADIEAALDRHADFVVISDQYAAPTWDFYKGGDHPATVFRNERFVVVGREETHP